LIVFTNSSTTFVIDVLTWCGQQKALKALKTSPQVSGFALSKLHAEEGKA
jgi:hypothetical protein